MKVSHQDGGRVNQKRRTREAIVNAAKDLLQSGVVPTVARAAEAASVSRATAYRYFPTREALLFEVGTVTPSAEPIERVVAGLDGSDPESRLGALVSGANERVFANEPVMRAALRLYMEQWLQQRSESSQDAPLVREGRRLRWLDVALHPLRRSLTDKQWRRLRAALSLTIGVEALVVMKDICGVEDDEAFEVLTWVALALLRAAQAEHSSAT